MLRIDFDSMQRQEKVEGHAPLYRIGMALSGIDTSGPIRHDSNVPSPVGDAVIFDRSCPSCFEIGILTRKEVDTVIR